jgi:hypothetical protein
MEFGGQYVYIGDEEDELFEESEFSTNMIATTKSTTTYDEDGTCLLDILLFSSLFLICYLSLSLFFLL